MSESVTSFTAHRMAVQHTVPAECVMFFTENFLVGGLVILDGNNGLHILWIFRRSTSSFGELEHCVPKRLHNTRRHATMCTRLPTHLELLLWKLASDSTLLLVFIDAVTSLLARKYMNEYCSVLIIVDYIYGVRI